MKESQIKERLYFKNDTNINIKDHPVFILKRIIEDYNVVSKYIADILDEIGKDILKSFENEKN